MWRRLNLFFYSRRDRLESLLVYITLPIVPHYSNLSIYSPYMIFIVINWPLLCIGIRWVFFLPYLKIFSQLILTSTNIIHVRSTIIDLRYLELGLALPRFVSRVPNYGILLILLYDLPFLSHSLNILLNPYWSPSTSKLLLNYPTLLEINIVDFQ